MRGTVVLRTILLGSIRSDELTITVIAAETPGQLAKPLGIASGGTTRGVHMHSLGPLSRIITRWDMTMGARPWARIALTDPLRFRWT